MFVKFLLINNLILNRMLPVLLKNNYFQRNTKQILSSNIKLIYYFCCIDLMRSIIAAFSCCTSKNLGYWFWVSILISSCFTQTPVVIHNLSLSDVSLRYETKSVELLRTLLFPLFSYHSYLSLFVFSILQMLLILFLASSMSFSALCFFCGFFLSCSSSFSLNFSIKSSNASSFSLGSRETSNAAITFQHGLLSWLPWQFFQNLVLFNPEHLLCPVK